ncbi:unnamed protein product [Moneuplotes crassus]|uniref:Uncharacterized protein n=1 Tax=Euplotes crassus TaxID=5936 RepID=A0AAD1UJU0_EUPCR|nr:unnamed protein product [Moneuplotes crassus]
MEKVLIVRSRLPTYHLTSKRKRKVVINPEFHLLSPNFRENYIKAKKKADRFEEVQQCKKIWKENKRLFNNLKNCKGQLYKLNPKRKIKDLKSPHPKIDKKDPAGFLSSDMVKAKKADRSVSSIRKHNFSTNGFHSVKESKRKAQKSFDSFSSEPYTNRLETSLDKSTSSLHKEKVRRINEGNRRLQESLNNVKPTICIKDLKNQKSFKNPKKSYQKFVELVNVVKPVKAISKEKLLVNTKRKSRRWKQKLNLPDINQHIPLFKRNASRVDQVSPAKNEEILAQINQSTVDKYYSFDRKNSRQNSFYQESSMSILKNHEMIIEKNIKKYLENKPLGVPEAVFTDISTKSNSSLDNYKRKKQAFKCQRLRSITEEMAVPTQREEQKKIYTKSGIKLNIIF